MCLVGSWQITDDRLQTAPLVFGGVRESCDVSGQQWADDRWQTASLLFGHRRESCDTKAEADILSINPPRYWVMKGE
jgi:hypothetical protein